MNLIESYSRILGTKIGKPKVYSKYYALPFEQYITVQSSSPMPAKTYPYLQDVIDTIKPELDKLNISIVQLGGKEDHALRGVMNLCGQTSINHSAYIISNAKLHLGIDSAMIHLASVYNTPTIGIYSVSPPSNCGAFFGDNNIAIEPEFEGRNYAYNPGENPSPTRTIKPERVASAVFKQLGITGNLPESLFFGHRYQDKVIEFLPTNMLHPQFEQGKTINIRLDFAFQLGKFNDQVMMNTLASRECIIVTDRPLNLEMLAPLKSKIKTLIYILDKDDNIDFARKLKEKGIKFDLVSEAEEKINDFKFKYMDYGIVHLIKRSSKEEIEKVRLLNLNDLKYKSNRYILSEGKVYISKAALIEDKPLNSVDIFSQNLNIIENKENILQELEHFYIYGQT